MDDKKTQPKKKSLWERILDSRTPEAQPQSFGCAEQKVDIAGNPIPCQPKKKQ